LPCPESGPGPAFRVTTIKMILLLHLDRHPERLGQREGPLTVSPESLLMTVLDVLSLLLEITSGQVFLKKFPGLGAHPGPLDFVHFLILRHFTTEPQRLPIPGKLCCSKLVCFAWRRRKHFARKIH
jgi:hypothetical protein